MCVYIYVCGCVCVCVKWVVSIHMILNPHNIKPFIQRGEKRGDGEKRAKALRTDLHMTIKEFTFSVNIILHITRAEEVKVAKFKVWA